MREENDSPFPTAPENIAVSARNFAETEKAERFGHTIANTVRAISRYIDLERLDGITVAFDYDEALAELDRGYQATRALTRTSDDKLLGVAMAAAVLRDGVVKGHLVFDAPSVLPLEEETNDDFRQALYLVAHECGHIADLKHRDERFPGTILQHQIEDFEEALFEPIIAALWDEYAACRISAIFGEDQAPVYEESFVGALDGARQNANDAIRAYREHGDLNRVLEEAGRPMCEPLRLAAYLMGHLDGLGEDWDIVPEARDRLANSPYAPFVDRLGEALREAWSCRDSWDSPAVFDPLKDIAHDVLTEGGIILSRMPDGRTHVDLPFTPETMPD